MSNAILIRRICFMAGCFLGFISLCAQNLPVQKTVVLGSQAEESSGLLYWDGRMITHNDSGNNPELYEIDTADGSIKKIITVSNAANMDWEDLAQDDDYIYIGDFGNNFGVRKDLTVYRISKSGYAQSTTGTVQAESIHFSYEDQKRYDSSEYQTEYDAEALIAYGDSIYIFTKSWKSMRSYVYALPRIPGTYTVSRVDSLEVEGLVTGATVIQGEKEVFLTGYFPIRAPFIWRCSNFSGRFSSGSNEKFTLTNTGSPSLTGMSVEGICAVNGSLFLSSDGNANGPAYLFRIEIPALVAGIASPAGALPFSIHPNPAKERVYIVSDRNIQVELINGLGRVAIVSGNSSAIDISALPPGVYTVRLTDTAGNARGYGRMLVE